MTDEDVIQHAAAIFGTTVMSYQQRGGGVVPRRDDYKRVFSTTVCAWGNVLDWMRRPYPFLGSIRREKINRILIARGHSPLEAPPFMPARDSVGIAWLAGLLEAEGAFGHFKGSPNIQVQMLDEETVGRVATLFTSDVGLYRRRHPVFFCRVHGAEAIAWMLTLYRFMGARRRRKIRDIIAAWKASRRRPRARRGQLFMAICHPDRIRAAEGLCDPCYMAKYRKVRNYQNGTRSRELAKLRMAWGSRSLPPRRSPTTRRTAAIA